MRTTLLLFVLSGCIETGLIQKDDVGAFEPDSGTFFPDTDVSSESGGGDTGATRVCADRAWPAEPVAQRDECTPPAPTLDAYILWNNPDVGQVITSPAVAHLTDDDGDGVPGSAGDIPDIVALNVFGELFVLSGVDGSVVWSVTTAIGLDPASPAVGDLDGDGWADIVIGGTGGTQAYDRTGAWMWDGGRAADLCGALAIADLEADGQAEVVVGASILSGVDGALRGTGAHGRGTGVFGGIPTAAIGVVADLDRDGIAEVIAGNAAYDPTLATLWSNGETDGWVAVADFDGDAEGEVVVSAQGRVRLQDADGTVRWTFDLGEAQSGPPTVDDFDGDGAPEIGVATYTGYHVLDGDGTERWSSVIDDSSSGSVVGAAMDFDADGHVDIVVADQQDVWIFDGRDGAVLFDEIAHSSSTCNESAVIADVDADGSADIVWASYAVPAFGPEDGISVMSSASRTWPATRGTWNQHAYSITNIEDDGGVPAGADPNWRTYNNFRAAVGVPAAEAPDLTAQILDVCVDTCATGSLWMWLAVTNRGPVDVNLPVEAVVYAVGGAGRVDLARVAFAGVPAGTRSEGQAIELTGFPEGIFELAADVDPAGVFAECDETNNTDTWGDLTCG